MNLNKDDLIKVFGGLAVLVMVLSSFGVNNEAIGQVGAGLAIVLLIAGLAFLGERSTELVKMIARFAFGNVSFLKWLQPKGAGSVLLAFVMSLAGIVLGDVSLFDKFEVFKSVDPQLIDALTLALLWFGSSLWHNNLPKDVAMASPVK